MKEFSYPVNPVNVPLLHQELETGIGAEFDGVVVGPAGIRVIVADTYSNKATVDALIEAHDSSQLTNDQQRQVAFEQIRAANATPLDPAAYSGQNALIQKLAQKIAWLEQEIIDSRGLR